MNKVAVLDCTLRDGGYVNNFEFSEATIKTIISKLGKAHMDVIECGFLEDTEYDKDKSVYSRTEQIVPMIEKKRKRSMYVAMIVTGKMPASKVSPRTEDGIDGIRVTFHKKEIDEAFALGYALMDKGYEVFMQPVGTTTYKDSEILDLIERINEMKPYAFYLVDTLGKLYIKQLMKLFYLVDDNLDEDIVIGYHSHNNLQLSFSNAQALIQNRGKRSVMIDGSVLGMGRGAGNLCSEIMVQYINENMEYRYHTDNLIELIDDYINPISYVHPWGYRASYFLAATNNCHPNYVNFLLDKQTLNVKRLHQVLKKIPENERALYNEKLISSLYMNFQENEVDDSKALKKMEDWIKGKDLVVVAPGKSLLDERETIEKFLKNDNQFILTVNCIPDGMKPDALFISNQKRYHNLKQEYDLGNLDFPIIKTSNISTGGKNLNTVNYADLVMEDPMISDNAGLMMFNLLIRIGVEKMSLIGFDGYHTNVERNYFAPKMINSAERDNLRKINKHIMKQLEVVKSQIEITYITSSVYNGSQE
ncbi:MAG: aldolase catalytic domain-containing protein [Anaerostipes sp.]|jgi:4-hydroxy 2-oxovalerate aldolase